jgi:crotonobetainyl-CoA:carnitine CoA-transferase CaiB-like acyl-CoA transferase
MEARRPLDGITVVDFSHYIAGSFATMVLADLGARVVKIESSVHLDGMRRTAPAPTQREPIERPGAYQFIHGKQSAELNFRTPEGHAAVLDLIRTADLVVENFRHGTLDRAGLDYATLHAVNPRIIVASIRAFLLSTTLRDVRAGAPAVQAISGVDSGIGYTCGEPLALGRPMGDTVTGLCAVVGILAALRRRELSGAGEQITIGIDESLIATFAGLHLAVDNDDRPASPVRSGNARRGLAPCNVYPCAGDDDWLSIACRTEAEWSGLVDALGAPSWTADPRFADRYARITHVGYLDLHLARWCATRCAGPAARLLQEHGVAAVPLARPDEQLADEHLAARGLVTWLEHQRIGRHPVVNTMFHLQSAPTTARSSAPEVGADTAILLGR